MRSPVDQRHPCLRLAETAAAVWLLLAQAGQNLQASVRAFKNSRGVRQDQRVRSQLRRAVASSLEENVPAQAAQSLQSQPQQTALYHTEQLKLETPAWDVYPIASRLSLHFCDMPLNCHTSRHQSLWSSKVVFGRTSLSKKRFETLPKPCRTVGSTTKNDALIKGSLEGNFRVAETKCKLACARKAEERIKCTCHCATKLRHFSLSCGSACRVLHLCDFAQSAQNLPER